MLHQLLQWHHRVSSWYPPTNVENLRVNERVPPSQWLAWDLGFLAWGAAMLVLAAVLLRRTAASVRA